ncbi:MAG: type II toxin-antitoxin system Phd/YefM family antitoxin [Planctomycetes bacterium]|nr:type II toxin-antitoxin system Phd/YefM family antitoxin [Planctomycetota bacterium]
MRVVNVKELKARLSAYLREVRRGETFLVTQRDAVVARLAPPTEPSAAAAAGDGVVGRLLALGARPPLRARGPRDYRRSGTGAGLGAKEIDALLDDVRGEPR